MTLLDVIKNRRSIREFKPESISEEKVDKLIEALIWAPSAGNLQSRKFYFIFNQEIKKRLAQAALGQDFIAQAPLVVVGCADTKIEEKYGQRGSALYSICDVSVSIENMLLIAYNEGLASCWVGAFDEESVSRILNMPVNLRPVAIVPVGFPAEEPSVPSRVSKEEAIEIIK